MERNYELTDETIEIDDCILHRIKCIKEFSCQGKLITIGTLGGFVGGYYNLLDDAWVDGEAKVFEEATVFDGAYVDGQSVIVRQGASIFDHAKILGNATIMGSAIIAGFAVIKDNAIICGDSFIGGNVKIRDNVTINGKNDSIHLNGSININGDAKIYGETDYMVIKSLRDHGSYFVWTKNNNCWSYKRIHFPLNELSERYGNEYNPYIEFINNIKSN